MIYIAVVCTFQEFSGRPEGDWSCFTDKDKNAAITKALVSKRKWEEKGYGPYRVLVGKVVEEVLIPMRYRLQSIEE